MIEWLDVLLLNNTHLKIKNQTFDWIASVRILPNSSLKLLFCKPYRIWFIVNVDIANKWKLKKTIANVFALKMFHTAKSKYKFKQKRGNLQEKKT